MRYLKYALFIIFLANSSYSQDSLNCKLISRATGVNAYSLAVKDNYAFISSDKFYILDISDINNPVKLFEDSIAYETSSIYTEGNYAYLGASDGLIILDITSPAAPQIINYYKTEEYIQEVTVDRGIAYLGTLNQALLVIDVSDPHNPHEIARVNTNIDDIWNIEIVNNILFAASEDTGVKIFSIENPAAPVELSTLTLTLGTTAVDVKIKDSIAYVAHPSYLYTFNIADITNPQMIGYLEKAGGNSIFIEGNYAYCNNNKQLRVVDISNPDNLNVVGFYPLLYTGADIFVKDKLVYTTCQIDGLYFIKFDAQTGITDRENAPGNFSLSQNYPNPFNPITTINYSIPNTSFVTLKVYDILGKEITTLVSEEKPGGNYNVEFNASKLASGVYYYKIQSGSFSETKKLILIK